MCIRDSVKAANTEFGKSPLGLSHHLHGHLIVALVLHHLVVQEELVHPQGQEQYQVRQEGGFDNSAQATQKLRAHEVVDGEMD